MSSGTTKKTPLYDWHVSHGAKMVEFGGWLMPVSYQGVLAEHRAVREACGLFDISHMGEIFVEGEGSRDFLQSLTTNDVGKLSDGEAQYSLLLNPDGFPLDDIIVYRYGPRRFMLCVNAANTDKDFSWIRSRAPAGVELKDASATLGMIALQGPKSPKVLSRMGFDLSQLPRFHFAETDLAGVSLTVSRTGYTGEDGCEFFLPAGRLLDFWEALSAAGRDEGIQAVGLGARDTLRLEMGYALYGHEINESIQPLEAGLSWVVAWEKGDFVGREALRRRKEEGPVRKMVGLMMEEPGIPRSDLEVIHKGKAVGKVLSGTFSPTLEKGIATALVAAEAAVPGGEIFVDIRGKMKKAKIVKLPFLQK